MPDPLQPDSPRGSVRVKWMDGEESLYFDVTWRTSSDCLLIYKFHEMSGSMRVIEVIPHCNVRRIILA